MWYTAESNLPPSITDTESSKKHAYLRRNIREESRTDEAGDKHTVYVYEECKIPKDVFVLVIAQGEQNSRLNDIEEVITELIGGEGI